MSKTTAIIGLILNIIIWPGLGTLINKKWLHGILQAILFTLGLILIVMSWGSNMFRGGTNLSFLLIPGIIISLSAYIWSIISSIKLIKLI